MNCFALPKISSKLNRQLPFSLTFPEVNTRPSETSHVFWKIPNSKWSQGHGPFGLPAVLQKCTAQRTPSIISVFLSQFSIEGQHI